MVANRALGVTLAAVASIAVAVSALLIVAGVVDALNALSPRRTPLPS
jgi:hypothetical protein